jgi:Ca2+-binding RTX toxin-like protein
LARTREIALVASLSACLFACDIVQGFQHAGDALFPEVKTYLDVPGYRLVEGRYGRIDMVRSSEPYILARSATAGDETLYAMRFHAPKPCKIPNVARYWTDGGFHAERTYIAYFEPDDPETLRFSDMACTAYDGRLLTPHLPVSYTQTGLVVQIDDELYEVNPSTATSRFLAGRLQRIDAGRALVQADGRLGVFDGNWRLVRWVGEGVVGYAAAFGTFYFEDEAGISRLSINTDEDGVRTATTSSVAEDACGLTVLPETPDVQLLAFYTPCIDGKLVLWDARSRRTLPFDRELDPRYLKIQAAPANGARPDLTVDPYFALYLTEVDAGTGTGTLRIRGSDGTELVIGERAALERSELTRDEGGESFTGGFALVDVDGENGRFVRFDLAGTVTEVVSGVLRNPAEPDWRRLVIDVDGTLADLAEVVDGAPHVVARNVPRRRYAYVQRASYAPLYGSMAWYHDVQGDTGSLSLARKSDKPNAPLDDQGHEPVYEGTLVARGVHLDAHGFLDDLPGFVYFTHWDYATGTGRLEYSNVELGFSAVVGDGVADYLQPGTGLIYSVPSGEAAGIWLARGK